jgi:hypothetical protein
MQTLFTGNKSRKRESPTQTQCIINTL